MTLQDFVFFVKDKFNIGCLPRFPVAYVGHGKDLPDGYDRQSQKCNQKQQPRLIAFTRLLIRISPMQLAHQFDGN